MQKSTSLLRVKRRASYLSIRQASATSPENYKNSMQKSTSLHKVCKNDGWKSKITARQFITAQSAAACPNRWWHVCKCWWTAVRCNWLILYLTAEPQAASEHCCYAETPAGCVGPAPTQRKVPFLLPAPKGGRWYLQKGSSRHFCTKETCFWFPMQRSCTWNRPS